jgi:hypothetical protein
MQRIVVDHQSTDSTAAVAQDAGAAVFTRPFTGFVDARLFALGQVRTAWTLMIDADEVLDQRLRSAILAACEDADGYYVRRNTFFCGKALRMWREERLLRLFRSDRATLAASPAAGGGAQLHEHWHVTGAARDLGGVLLHDSYPSRESYRKKFDEYTTIEAAAMPPASAASLLAAAAQAALRFAYLLALRGCLLDGWRGVYVAFFTALYRPAVLFKARRGR